MWTKKSLVLLSSNNEREKAVLSLENDSELISGRLRLYNFNSEPEGILSLGFYDGGKVRKCGLVKNGEMLYTFKTDTGLNEEFSCAVVNFIDAKPSPLLFGSTQGATSSQEVLAALSGEVMDENNPQKVEEILDEAGVEYDDELTEQIDQEITKNMEVEEPARCADCKYKKCFFGEQEPEKPQKVRFIDEIGGQIDKLFASSPTETFLEEMIPFSKFVRVEFEGESDYYILGLIYDEAGKVKFVCYGVPGIYQKTPPSSLSGYPVWLPLDENKRESFGYWLTYQDADSGQSIKAIVE